MKTIQATALRTTWMRWVVLGIVACGALCAHAQEGGMLLDPSGNPAMDAVVTAPGTGGLIAAWSAYDGSWFRVKARVSNDGGQAWNDPVQLSSGELDAYYPAIVSEGGMAYIAWADTDGAKYGQVMACASSDSGATWSAPYAVSDSAPGVSHLRLAAQGATAWLVWTDCSSGVSNVMAASTTNSGASWSSPQAVAASAKPCRYPSVAMKGGAAHLVWEQWGAQAPEIAYASKTGNDAWTTPVLLSADDRWASESPTIAANAEDLFVAWRQDSADVSVISFTRLRNGQPLWDMPVALAAGASSSYPELAATGQRIVLAYEREGQAMLLESLDAGDAWGESQAVSESGWNGLARICLGPVYYYMTWTQEADGTVRLAVDPMGATPDMPAAAVAGAALLLALMGALGWRFSRQTGR